MIIRLLSVAIFPSHFLPVSCFLNYKSSDLSFFEFHTFATCVALHFSCYHSGFNDETFTFKHSNRAGLPKTSVGGCATLVAQGSMFRQEVQKQPVAQTYLSCVIPSETNFQPWNQLEQDPPVHQRRLRQVLLSVLWRSNQQHLCSKVRWETLESAGSHSSLTDWHVKEV